MAETKLSRYFNMRLIWGRMADKDQDCILRTGYGVTKEG